MATTNGPATGNATVQFPPNTPFGIEVQVPVGLPSLDCNAAPYVNPAASTYISNAIGASSSIVGAIAKTVAGVKFAIPA